jgi:hypothetical protein
LAKVSSSNPVTLIFGGIEGALGSKVAVNLIQPIHNQAAAAVIFFAHFSTWDRISRMAVTAAACEVEGEHITVYCECAAAHPGYLRTDGVANPPAGHGIILGETAAAAGAFGVSGRLGKQTCL